MDDAPATECYGLADGHEPVPEDSVAAASLWLRHHQALSNAPGVSYARSKWAQGFGCLSPPCPSVEACRCLPSTRLQEVPLALLPMPSGDVAAALPGFADRPIRPGVAVPLAAQALVV